MSTSGLKVWGGGSVWMALFVLDKEGRMGVLVGAEGAAASEPH